MTDRADAVEAARQVRKTVELLANTPMDLSLTDWCTHSAVLIHAADLLSRVPKPHHTGRKTNAERHELSA
jgi:hypothetical protein